MAESDNNKPFVVDLYLTGLMMIAKDQNGSRSVLLHNAIGRAGKDRHAPLLRYEAARTCGSVLLRRCRLDFSYDKPHDKKDPNGEVSYAERDANATKPCPESATDAQAFDWVLPLADFTGTNGKPSWRALTGKSKLVQGVLHVNHGRFSTAMLAMSGDKANMKLHKVKVLGAPANKKWDKVAAEVVRVRMTAPTDAKHLYLDFVGLDRKGDDDDARIRLEPDKDNRIKLAVYNSPPQDKRDKKAVHFKMMRNLLAEKPTHKPLPELDEECPKDYGYDFPDFDCGKVGTLDTPWNRPLCLPGGGG